MNSKMRADDSLKALGAGKKVSFDEENLKQLASQHGSCEEELNNVTRVYESAPLFLENMYERRTNILISEDQTLQSTTSIKKPNDNDIISGRGAGVNQHPGNEYYRKLIKSHKQHYVNSDPGKKKLIIRYVFEKLNEHGRFLKYDCDTEEWTKLPNEEARKKVAQALRENAPAMKKQNHQEALERNLNFEAPAQLNTVPRYLSPTSESSEINILPGLVSTERMSGLTATSPQLLASSNLSNNVDVIRFLLSRAKGLKKNQENLKRKQREMEYDHNQLMQQLRQMATSVMLETSLNSVSGSNSDNDESYFVQQLLKRRKIG